MPLTVPIAPADGDTVATDDMPDGSCTPAAGIVVGVIAVNAESVDGGNTVSVAVPSLTSMTLPATCVPTHAVPRSSCAGAIRDFGVTTLPVTGNCSVLP